jgi:hypothetical protein
MDKDTISLWMSAVALILSIVSFVLPLVPRDRLVYTLSASSVDHRPALSDQFDFNTGFALANGGNRPVMLLDVHVMFHEEQGKGQTDPMRCALSPRETARKFYPTDTAGEKTAFAPVVIPADSMYSSNLSFSMHDFDKDQAQVVCLHLRGINADGEPFNILVPVGNASIWMRRGITIRSLIWSIYPESYAPQRLL